MQKKFFSVIILLTLISSCFTPLRGFAATEETLAEFSYTAPEGALEGDSLAYGDKNSGYSATKGQTSAKLFASVDGTDYKKLEWSDATYSNSSMVPIMKPSKSTQWGASPYFEIVCSTKDYENIKFSAKVSGSKKGPATYALQYKTNNGTYTDITKKKISKNKDMTSNLFDRINIPSGADDQDTVYFRIIATDTVALTTKPILKVKQAARRQSTI